MRGRALLFVLHAHRTDAWLLSGPAMACFLGQMLRGHTVPHQALGMKIYTPGSACLQIRSQKWQDFLSAEHEAGLQSKHVVEQALLHLPGAVELVHGCLHWDPDQRWTAGKALQSPLFSGLPQIPQ